MLCRPDILTGVHVQYSISISSYQHNWWVETETDNSIIKIFAKRQHFQYWQWAKCWKRVQKSFSMTSFKCVRCAWTSFSENNSQRKSPSLIWFLVSFWPFLISALVLLQEISQEEPSLESDSLRSPFIILPSLGYEAKRTTPYTVVTQSSEQILCSYNGYVHLSSYR